jgi:hypothetical protein
MDQNEELNALRVKLITLHEILGSADINLDNLAKTAPILILHPFFKIVKMQLSDAMKLIRGESYE